MSHPKVTTIAEAFKLAANVAKEKQVSQQPISDEWMKTAQYEPIEAIAYTHADRIAAELEALAEEYEE